MALLKDFFEQSREGVENEKYPGLYYDGQQV